MTTGQAGDVLGVSAPVVRAMVRRGELAGMQVAGRCYVGRQEVETLAAARDSA
jgi:excisionase family DNA binding protein